MMETAVIFYPKADGKYELIAFYEYDEPIADLEKIFTEFSNFREMPWSMQTDSFGTPNPEYCKAIRVVKPLPDFSGQKYGHRSMMVGDVIICGGYIFRVDYAGFKKISTEEFIAGWEN